MDVKWFESLNEIASTYPLIFVLAILMITLVPKTLDYLINKKKMQLESEETLLDKISNRVNLLQDRCESLEKEVDEWRDRYYKMKEELSNIEIDNKRLLAELQGLKGSSE